MSDPLAFSLLSISSSSSSSSSTSDSSTYNDTITSHENFMVKDLTNYFSKDFESKDLEIKALEPDVSWIIEGILTREECKTLIAETEKNWLPRYRLA